jgi:ubiquinone biosynthesis protein COQ9
VDKIKQEILQASIQFVVAHGFTKEAIAKGAESINYPGTAHGIFPNGGIELIQYFYTSCNKVLNTLE